MTLQEQIAKLQAENEALRTGTKTLSLKVSEKGAVSVHGMGRFPVTLYKQQWKQLLEIAGQITQFLNDNDSKLTVKGA